MPGTWWDANALKDLELFQRWVGDHTAPSKVAARRHVVASGFRSVLDAGCGTCTEYVGYRQDGPQVRYYGVDSCRDLVKLAVQNGVPNILLADLEALPFGDNSVEVVYIRHVLEHLATYEHALGEAIRVASREVLVNWFLRCTDAEPELRYDPELNLRHNRYHRPAVETFVRGHAKVRDIRWAECGNPDEEFLHIVLRV